MEMTPDKPETCTGDGDELELEPQAQTVPSPFSASENREPALMATTPESPETCTGLTLDVIAPFPSSPDPPWPHAQTVPFCRSASAC
jgi:hypothetical protein